MSSVHDTLTNALNSALSLYGETMGEPFEVIPELDVIDEAVFGAVAERDDDRFVIRVSSGTVDVVTKLWFEAFADKGIFNGSDPLSASKNELINMSLVWLMLHEMHHLQMGHFELLGRAYLTESFGSNSMAVAKQASAPNPILADLDEEDIEMVEPCLEMQADHDALEMLLDAYSTERWQELRARTAAVSAMMMLIEREDAKFEQEHSSHPKAATRIFQLLGHLSHMPTIQAMLAARHPELGIDPAIPSEQETKTYTSKVVGPAFHDAHDLARVAYAETIREDMGKPDDFFNDVEIALTSETPDPSDFATQGASQWAELGSLNTKLLRMLKIGS